MRHVLLLGLSVGLCGSLLLGYSLTVLNTAIPALTVEFEWCGRHESIATLCAEATAAYAALNSSLVLGAAAGCLAAGNLLRRLGRRNSLAAVHIGFLCTAAASVVTTDGSIFRCIRLCTGFCVGAGTVIPPVYLNELAPARLSKLVALLPAVAANAGILLGIVLGLPLQQFSASVPLTELEIGWNRRWWRFMIGFPACLSALSLLALITALRFETPAFLRSRGKPAADVELVLWGRDTVPVGAASALTTTTADAAEEEKKEELAPADVRGRHGAPLTFAQFRQFVPALTLAWVVSSGQQLSGMNAILATSNNIFLRSGLPAQWLSALSCLMALILLVASLLSTALSAGMPLHTLLASGACCMGLSLLLLPFGSLFLSEALARISAMLAVLAFAVLYGLSYGPCLLAYMFEVLPDEVKEVGLSVGFALNWLASVAAVQISANVSLEAAFTFFAVVCFAMSLLVALPRLRHTAREQKMELEGGSSSSAMFSFPRTTTVIGRKLDAATASEERTPALSPPV